MIIKMLKYSTEPNQLEVRKLFEQYGTVKSVVSTPKALFVNMPDTKNAQLALNALNGKSFNGHVVHLKKHRSKGNTSVCRTALGMFKMF